MHRWRVKNNEGSFHPLDRHLGLYLSEPSAALRETICDLFCRIPYRQVADLTARGLGQVRRRPGDDDLHLLTRRDQLRPLRLRGADRGRGPNAEVRTRPRLYTISITLVCQKALRRLVPTACRESRAEGSRLPTTFARFRARADSFPEKKCCRTVLSGPLAGEASDRQKRSE